MFGLGTQELLIILAILLIFFGATKIPQLARSLGKGIGEFRKAQQEAKEELLREGAQGPGVPAASLVCPGCREQASADAVFCAKCGQQLRATVCTNCHRTLQPGDQFCPGCGRAVR